MYILRYVLKLNFNVQDLIYILLPLHNSKHNFKENI